jgi:tRNA threonylcarbamoyladenosine biosynthesis protein TsaE
LGQSLILPDPQATGSLARAVAAALPIDASGWAILLQGELGAGKSTFARAMLHALGYSGTVPSPTYTLVEPYLLPKYSVYHIDLYRIESADDVEYLGWSDLQDGLRLVEWPERAPQLDHEADIRIALRYDGEGRAADLTGLSERGAAVLAALEPGS